MGRIVQIGLVAMALQAAALAQGPPPRAMWVWEAQTFQMLEDTSYRNAAVDFLVDHGITTVYLYADAYDDGSGLRNLLLDRPDLYQDVVTQLHGSGREVYALLGSAGLNTPEYIKPENRTIAEAMFQRVLDYNQSASVAQQFDGVNIDIEPYLLDDWESNTLTRATQYLDLSSRYIEMKDQYLADNSITDPTAFPVGPATPFWFDTPLGDAGLTSIDWNGIDQPMHKHVLNIHDYTTILAYRDYAIQRFDGRTDGIVFHSANELAYAQEVGKTMVVAVETGPTAFNHVTFLEEDPDLLEHELGLALDELASLPPFAGFAIHDFLNYQILVGDVIPEPSTLLVCVAFSLAALGRRGTRVPT